MEEDQEVGRVASPNRLSSTMEPPSAGSLHPAGFDPARYEVGQRLWLVERFGNRNVGRAVTVSKVGRKWATLVADSARGVLDAGRVAIGSRSLDGGVYASPGKLFASEEAYEHDRRLNVLWSEIREEVSRQYARPDHMTHQKLLALRALLRDSDGSPKGGDAEGGSVHDSAGRSESAGIAP